MTPGYDDPAVQRRRLRVELKKARLDAGKTQLDVARAMDWSVSKVIRIESGEVSISRNDLRALLEHYEMRDKGRVGSLLELARVARESSPDLRGIHSRAFLDYLSFESSAWIIRNYEPVFVPGLLQTEEYALAVQIQACGASEETAQRRWEIRRQRQTLHERGQPPKMFFILDEAVIRRTIGGPVVMQRQLKQLKNWSAKPHISLQIVPLEVGAYLGVGVPFFLLEFQDPEDEEVLYLEHDTERTNDNPAETSVYRIRFGELANIALSPAESGTLLDRVIDEIDITKVEVADNPERSPRAIERQPKPKARKRSRKVPRARE